MFGTITRLLTLNLAAAFYPSRPPDLPAMLASVQAQRFRTQNPSGPMMRSKSDAQALLDWIDGLPGGEIGPVTIKSSLAGAGRGVFTTRDVQPGELLFAIPKEACVSLSAATLSVVAFFDAHEVPSDAEARERAQLAVYLAHRRLSGGGDSPYLDSSICPWHAKDQEHVLWWTDLELQLLSGCTAHAKARAMHLEVDLVVRVLMKVLRDRSREEVEEAVRGAFVSLHSRAFGFGDTWLVPIMDICNHQDRPNSVQIAEPWDADNAKVRYVMRAVERIPAGAEVTDEYGTAPDYEFGCRYGFVDLAGMHSDPKMWQAANMTRSSSRCARIQVANLEFSLSLEQVYHLNKMRSAAAAESLGLSDLFSCAELSAWVQDSNIVEVIIRASKDRLAILNSGRAVARKAAANGALPSHVALGEALRRSEELVLEEVLASLSNT